MGASHRSGPFFVGGVPINGASIPTSFSGTYFYVDADNGSDSYDGLTPQTAKATIAAAYALMTTNKHDVMIISANSGHTLTDQLTITKNRCHFFGLDPAGPRHFGQRTRINMGVTTGTAVAAIHNTGVGNSFHNLKITSSDTLATSLYAVAEGGEFTIWENCEFLKTTDLDQTGAAELLHNGDSCRFVGCSFGNCIYTVSVARQNVLFTGGTISGKKARDVYFENCIFQHRGSATTMVNCRATAADIERTAWFRWCTFWSAKTSSATQALVFGIASALTQGQVLLDHCTVMNITDVCATGLGVFTNSVTPVADATEAVSVATT